MGAIDLDPASCEMANQTVRATTYYTKEQNGLLQPWFGKVWLNPPYSFASIQHQKNRRGLFKSSIERFTTKLISEYNDGNVSQAIALLMAKTDAQWFRPIWEYPICFTDFKLKFNGVNPNPKTPLSHMFGTIFVYLGPNEARFVEVFSRFGRIAKAIDTPPERPHNLELWRDGCET